MELICHLCMKDIKKHFGTFDAFAKMKLVPIVRGINDTMQIWLSK